MGYLFEGEGGSIVPFRCEAQRQAVSAHKLKYGTAWCPFTAVH
jgi:hypothetical protein